MARRGLRPRLPREPVLLGQLIRYDLGNVFDPAYTMVAKIAKRYLPEPVA